MSGRQAKRQLEDILAIPGETAILASAKEGIGTDDILEAIVARVPPPKVTAGTPLQALLFDSYFDTYRGAPCGPPFARLILSGEEWTPVKSWQPRRHVATVALFEKRPGL